MIGCAGELIELDTGTFWEIMRPSKKTAMLFELTFITVSVYGAV
jgi:hypothetical protein